MRWPTIVASSVALTVVGVAAPRADVPTPPMPDTPAAYWGTALAVLSFVGSVGLAYGKLRGMLDGRFTAIEQRLEKVEESKVEVAVHDACHESTLVEVRGVAAKIEKLADRMDRVLDAMLTTKEN